MFLRTTQCCTAGNKNLGRGKDLSHLVIFLINKCQERDPNLRQAKDLMSYFLRGAMK